LDCSFHNDIAETSDGVYWVATNSDGVFRLDLRAGATAAARGGVRPRFTRYPVGSEPVTNRVNVLYRDPDGILWAGTDGGLFALNEACGEQVFSPVALRIPLRPDIQVQYDQGRRRNRAAWRAAHDRLRQPESVFDRTDCGHAHQETPVVKSAQELRRP
jgi:hypothetical protein